MAIRIASNFKTGASQPLDEREVVDFYSDLANITTAYEGLEVWVLETKKKYRYVDSEWVDISVVAGSEVTLTELNALQGVTSNIQQQLNKIVNNSSVSDVDVRTWDEFKEKVTESSNGDLRIHIRENLYVSGNSNELDLSRCQIFGHYNKIVFQGKTPKINGNYAYFDTVYFQGASKGSASNPLFEIYGKSSTSCQFIFNNCRFYNCLEVSDNVVFDMKGASEASLHLILITCTINGESSNTRNRVFLIKNNNSLCISLKNISLLFGNKGQETNKFGFVGNKSQHDIFFSDGSCVFVPQSVYKKSDLEPNIGYPDSFWQWGVQQQADWEQADSTKPDFIKNKPNTLHTQNTDSKIANAATNPTTQIECKATAIEQFGKQYQGRYWEEDSQGVNAITVGSGTDSQNTGNIQELTWNGRQWTKLDVTCGGTANNPTHKLSMKINGINISQSDFDKLESYEPDFFYFVYNDNE